MEQGGGDEQKNQTPTALGQGAVKKHNVVFRRDVRTTHGGALDRTRWQANDAQRYLT